MKEKTDAARRELRNQKDTDQLRLKRIFDGVEEGMMSKKRRKLEEAAKHARQHGSILIATDLSRFIRSESYHRVRNPEAWPTTKEFERLLEITDGVQLVTLLDPALTESQRHSWLTKRTGKCGRPSTLSDLNKLRILEWFEVGESYAAIANRLRLGKAGKQKVNRFLSSPVPGHDKLRWKDLAMPSAAFRQVNNVGIVTKG